MVKNSYPLTLEREIPMAKGMDKGRDKDKKKKKKEKKKEKPV
jgi:hypothetical protein